MRQEGGEETISYEQISPAGSFFVESYSDGRFAVRRDRGEKSSEPPLQFLQVPDGPVSLTVGRGSSRKVYQAASLWHLALACPRSADSTCFHYWQPFRAATICRGPSRRLKTTFGRGTAPSDISSRQRLKELVEQLGENQFAKRQAAERELRRDRRVGRVVFRSARSQ